MKKLIWGYAVLCCLAAGMAAVGCAGPQTESGSQGADEESEAAGASEEDVGEAEQAICGPGANSVCTGWDAGGRRCLANCSGMNYWADTGAAYWFSVDACYSIDFGQCGSTAQAYCNGLGRSYEGSVGDTADMEATRPAA